uniref:Uncharacterized protein n=1 Tax=Myoviridae sp. ctHaT25 TaxID=2826635 RepID=A0A8S5NAT2_9CAUD|nr:MAG TPA: hypothetical protein [Myoviridae sp. ctHaT25]
MLQHLPSRPGPRVRLIFSKGLKGSEIWQEL